jgi:hypothetical protein
MRILIVSTFDLNGGAGKAAYRLLESLSNINGVEILMLVKEKSSNNNNVIEYNKYYSKYFNKILQALDNIFLLLYPERNKSLFSTSWISQSSISNVIEKFKPDLINIHWVNNGYLSIKQISKITTVPVVFSLHDMWILTGGCHYTLHCEKFKNKCYSCDQLNSKCTYDLSTFNFNRKKALINKHKNKFNFIN